MKNIRTIMVCMILPIFGLMHTTPAATLRTFDMRADSLTVAAAVLPLSTVNATEFKMKHLWRAQLSGNTFYPDTASGAMNIHDVYFGMQPLSGDDYFWTNAGAIPRVRGAVVVSDSWRVRVLPFLIQDELSAAVPDNKTIPPAVDLAVRGVNGFQTYGDRSEDWTSNAFLDAKGINNTGTIKRANPVP
jgi:hypothetical protein